MAASNINDDENKLTILLFCFKAKTLANIADINGKKTLAVTKFISRYPFIIFASSILMVFFWRKKTINIAKPIATSAAAIVKVNRTNI